MIKIFTIALVFFCTSVVSIAQNNDYYNLKEVAKFRFDHLELNTADDIKVYLQKTSEYNFIDALKVNQTTRLDEILSETKYCGFIRELDLSNYSGDYDSHTFDSCVNLEILHVTIREDKIDQLKAFVSAKQLQSLYITILGKTEKLKPFSQLPRLKELHIFGEFLPQDLSQLLVQIEEQSKLKTLSLSVDRITDLPKEIIKFKKIEKLNLYDNLSIFTNKGIDDLSEEKLSIIYNLGADLVNAISVSYFSNNGELAPFEKQFLQSVYNGEILPMQFQTDEYTNEEAVHIPFDKAFEPNFLQTSEFNPPYTPIQSQNEVFMILPGTNSVVYSNSGMKISIPANSFVNENGNQIEETIYLRIIQINKPTELLFTGIRLKNGSRQFCNNYMFNLSATTSKSSAKLKEGFQLKVLMPKAIDSSKLYFFDYESNTWQDQDFYNQVFATNFTPIDFYKLENGTPLNTYYQFDTSSFEQRFYGEHHYFLNDYKSGSQLLYKLKKYYTDLDREWINNYNKNGKLKGLKIKHGRAYVKIQKVIPKVRNKEKVYFKILDKTKQEILPELCAFKRINLNVPVDINNRREFTDNFIRNAKYFDVKIEYTNGKNYCDIILKTKDGFKKLTAYITDSDDKKLIKKQLLKFSKAYKKYLQIRSKRRKEFESLNLIRFNEFKAYTETKINGLITDNATSEVKIHQLGSFSLMYDEEPEFTTNIIAQYTDFSGLPIDIKDLFYIDSRYNTVFRKEVGNISFDPEYCRCFIATDYSGNLYYATKNDVSSSNLSNNSLTYIKLQKVNPSVNTIQMFNNLIRN
jgi:hypothetical protein